MIDFGIASVDIIMHTSSRANFNGASMCDQLKAEKHFKIFV